MFVAPGIEPRIQIDSGERYSTVNGSHPIQTPKITLLTYLCRTSRCSPSLTTLLLSLELKKDIESIFKFH
jgi:hypothetical protein